MRKVLILVVCCILLCHAACAETVGAASDRLWNLSENFCCTYCEESDTYWFVIRKGNGQIPLIPYYHAYYMGGDLSRVTYAFRSVSRIGNLLATKDGLYYDIDAGLHPRYANLSYFDASTRSIKVIAKWLGDMIACNPEYVLYRTEHGLHKTLPETGRSEVYSNIRVRGWSREGFYYSTPETDIRFYEYATGVSIPMPVPEEFSHHAIIALAYDHLMDWSTGRLYRYDNGWELVADFGRVTAFGIDGEYVCVGSVSDTGDRLLKYARLADLTTVHTVVCNGYQPSTVNLCNGHVFLRSNDGHSVCAVDLETQELITIPLP